MTVAPVEFLHDRVYLGAYEVVPKDTPTRVYLTVDDTLPYNNFHHDFGPLNIAALFRFAVIFHDVLGKRSNQGKAVEFVSYEDPRSRANAAALLTSYMVLVQSWQPHQVLAPIAQMDPVMPFRDAGYSQADFIVTIQDLVYALWRAKQRGLLEMQSFNLEEYERYELVENGDLNMIGPDFVAFASPVTGHESIKPVLQFFNKHEVQLVVRLNSPLYEPRIFEREGIKHIDLVFDDGTCPTMAFVQGFIGAAECVIANGGKIAVHCRAGLGRTGCLIGAHLIYKHGFTAQEAIAYMRFLRPGMVVGPQQHWLYQHQHEFLDWRRTMELSDVPDPTLGGLRPLVDVVQQARAREESEARRSLRNGVSLEAGPHTPQRSVMACLPEPTPGQPRKPASPVRVARLSNVEPHTPEAQIEASRASQEAPISEASPREAPISEASPRDASHESRISEGSPRSPLKSPTRAPAETRPEIFNDTNSDGSLYSCSETEDEAPRQRPLVSKTRNVSSSTVSSSTVSKRSTSSGSRHSSASRRSSRRDSENTGIIIQRQRRNITDIASPQQQLALAKQLRIASNPSPRKR